jgi:hypothetical protein
MARRALSRRHHVPRKKKATARAAPVRATAISRSSGLSIEDDRLVGGNVSFVETPNKGGDLAPRYLVFHYTAGKSATSSTNWLISRGNGAVPAKAATSLPINVPSSGKFAKSVVVSSYVQGTHTNFLGVTVTPA